MGKQEVVDYVMHTPGNSNEAVLRGLLDDMDSQSTRKPFVVTLTSRYGIYSCSKTFEEIYNAILEDCTNVYFIESNNGTGGRWELRDWSPNMIELTEMYVSGPWPDTSNNYLTATSLKIYSDGTIEKKDVTLIESNN